MSALDQSEERCKLPTWWRRLGYYLIKTRNHLVYRQSWLHAVCPSAFHDLPYFILNRRIGVPRSIWTVAFYEQGQNFELALDVEIWEFSGNQLGRANLRQGVISSKISRYLEHQHWEPIYVCSLGKDSDGCIILNRKQLWCWEPQGLSERSSVSSMIDYLRKANIAQARKSFIVYENIFLRDDVSILIQRCTEESSSHAFYISVNHILWMKILKTISHPEYLGKHHQFYEYSGWNRVRLRGSICSPVDVSRGSL